MAPRDIALRLNTSVENVWKEKSLLKSRAGLIVSRSTQELKKQSEIMLFDPEGEQGDRSSMALQKMKSRKSWPKRLFDRHSTAGFRRSHDSLWGIQVRKKTD